MGKIAVVQENVAEYSSAYERAEIAAYFFNSRYDGSNFDEVFDDMVNSHGDDILTLVEIVEDEE